MGKRAWAPCALLACGAAHSPQQAATTRTQAEPVRDAGALRIEQGNVADLDKREIDPLPKHAVHTPNLTGSVEAAADPTIDATDNKSTHITVPLGAPVEPMQCFVLSDEINPAGQITNLARSITSKPTLALVAVRMTDVAVAREHATIFVDIEYTTKEGGESHVGVAKVAVYAHQTMPLLCFHDQVGYHQTFERIVMGLANTMTLTGRELPSPRFVEIEVDKLEGHFVGFTRDEVADAEKGSKHYLSESTMLLSRSPTDFIASDSARFEVWEPNGHVGVISYAEVESGEMSEQLVLKRTSARDYAYEGTHAGKKISGKLTTHGAHGFESDMLVDPKIKKVALSGGDLSIETYHPDLDPTAPMYALFHAPSKADGTVTMSLGKLQVTGKVDAQGRLVGAETVVGPLKFTSERVLVRGSY